MNKEAPEDEMILAELIAATCMYGLRSCRGSMFRDKENRNLEMEDVQPPRNAVACCVQGAVHLLSQLPYLPSAALGNDANENDVAPYYLNSDCLRGWNIGAAFEIAMRNSVDTSYVPGKPSKNSRRRRSQRRSGS